MNAEEKDDAQIPPPPSKKQRIGNDEDDGRESSTLRLLGDGETEKNKDDPSSEILETNPFAALPLEIMKKITFYLRYDVSGNNDGNKVDPRALLQLASCDKFLQNLICNEFSHLWQDLDLGVGQETMTDSQLHAFLERINAKNVTQKLGLHNFRHVKGTGLTPLTDSQVLQSIDLRVGPPENQDFHHHSTGLDNNVVGGVLSSMLLPFKCLRNVQLNGPNNPGDVPFAMGDFLVRFSLAKARRLLEENTKCTTCQRLLGERLNSTTTNLESAWTATRCAVRDLRSFQL